MSNHTWLAIRAIEAIARAADKAAATARRSIKRGHPAHIEIEAFAADIQELKDRYVKRLDR